MTQLVWDAPGARLYETGVDRGVLYIPVNGVYTAGYAWNGLTTVTESPSGAEATPQYADNVKYLNLISAEDFGATIEAFTYPDAFAQCDGSVVANAGVSLGQQGRATFGLSYRTRLGNDQLQTDYGYKVHMVYGCLAAPSEKAYASINDTPEGISFSWELSTTPVAVGTVSGVTYKPTAILTVDSTKVSAANLAALETALYGSAGATPRLPLPAEVIAMFAGSITNATPTQPVYTAASHTITIPNITGVTYQINGITVTGSVVLTTGQQVLVVAVPAAGYVFPANTDTDWQYNY